MPFYATSFMPLPGKNGEKWAIMGNDGLPVYL